MAEDKGARAPILTGIVRAKIDELGLKQAEQFFGVGAVRVNHWRTGSNPVPLWAAELVYRDLLGKEDSAPNGDTLATCTTPPVTLSWEGKNLMICIPWYKTASPFTAISVLGIHDKSKMGIIMNCGDAFVSHTRNKIARTFLQTKAEWSLWVDDDMIIPIGNAEWFNQITGMALPAEFAGLHTANRLLSHGKTLVGGLYFGRAANGRPMYAEGASNPAEAQVARRGPQDICKPTKWVATGCLLIHRTVFEDVDKKFPHLNRNYFSPSEHDLYSAVEAIQKLLTDQSIPSEQRLLRAATMLESGRILSNTNSAVGVGEDVIFCTRAAAAGHQAYVDMGLVVGHVGSEVFGPFNTSPTGGFVRV